MRFPPADFESAASTCSATGALSFHVIGAWIAHPYVDHLGGWLAQDAGCPEPHQPYPDVRADADVAVDRTRALAWPWPIRRQEVQATMRATIHATVASIACAVWSSPSKP
jgi:hypothetical protein